MNSRRSFMKWGLNLSALATLAPQRSLATFCPPDGLPTHLDNSCSFEKLNQYLDNDFLIYGFKLAAKKRTLVSSPCFIIGPRGAGKTSFLHSFGNEVLKYDPDMKVLYISGEDLILDLSLLDTNKIKEKYRNYQMILFDDFDLVRDRVELQKKFADINLYLQNRGIFLLLALREDFSQISSMKDLGFSYKNSSFNLNDPREFELNDYKQIYGKNYFKNTQYSFGGGKILGSVHTFIDADARLEGLRNFADYVGETYICTRLTIGYDEGMTKEKYLEFKECFMRGLREIKTSVS